MLSCSISFFKSFAFLDLVKVRTQTWLITMIWWASVYSSGSVSDGGSQHFLQLNLQGAAGSHVSQVKASLLLSSARF